MNQLTVHERGLKPKIEMYRRNGRWNFTISLPRWALDDLEHEASGNVTLEQTSSGIVGGSGITDDATITFAVKLPAKLSE